jgi:hypothetical protein
MISTLLLAALLVQQSATVDIVVDAGARDRKNCVVAVPVNIPAPSAGATTAILEDGSGKTLQGQIASGRELRFVLPDLKAGQTVAYKVTFIREASKLDETFAWADTANDHAELSIGKRPLLRYMYKPLDESSKDARAETYKIFHSSSASTRSPTATTRSATCGIAPATPTSRTRSSWWPRPGRSMVATGSRSRGTA